MFATTSGYILARLVLGITVVCDLLSWVCILRRVMDERKAAQAAEAETVILGPPVVQAAAADATTWYSEVAKMHTDMWSHNMDANNLAARTLMAWWVLTLGAMRLTSLATGEKHLAILSYGIEATCFGIENAANRMQRKRANVACWLCVSCGFLMLEL